MIPFFFDDGLFGAFHSAGEEGTDVGAVLLYPAFGEYIQQHRLYYRLAEMLAERGIPTLRFDYFATGDSAGSPPEASLGRWRRDAAEAIGRLRREAGVGRIVLVGSRLGGLLACQIAAREPRVAALALWDPVVSGRDFLEELEAAHERQLGAYTGREETPPGLRELLGFSLAEPMYREISDSTLAASNPLVDQEVLVLSGAAVLDDVRTALDPSLTRVWYEEVSCPPGWLQPLDGIYDILVPLPLLRRTVGWIETHALEGVIRRYRIDDHP